MTALTNVKKGVVDRVRVAGNGAPGSTRVVLEMSKQYAYRVQPDAVNPRNVVVTIGDPASLGSTPADFTLAKAVAASAAPAATAVVRTPAAPVARTTRTEPTVQERKAGDMSPRRFTGHPISLDFQGVDLRAVLRTFAEITGLNLVIDPEVKGVVDVSLHEVPWDHALDIILRANQLDYTVEGTIVRIAPIETLRKEGEARRRLADEQALSGELVTVTKTLSYAKAADLAPLLLRTALTKRSSIQVDPRTNNLIITDLQAGIDRAWRAARRPRRAAAAGRDRGAHRPHHEGLRQGARHPVGLRRGRGAGAGQHHAVRLPEHDSRRRHGRHGQPAAAPTSARSAWAR